MQAPLFNLLSLLLLVVVAFALETTVEIATDSLLTKKNETNCEGPVTFLPLGKHYTLDFFDIPPESVTLLKDWEKLNEKLSGYIKSAGMTLLNVSMHKFDCGGLTAVWLLSESHMSIHTWPEHQFAALDVYTCGTANTDTIVSDLEKLLKPGFIRKNFIPRGDKFTAPPKTFPITQDMCINGDSEGEGDWNIVRNAALLDHVKSPFQDIKVFESKRLGRCMLLDDTVQYCTSDNHIYTRELVSRAVHTFKRNAQQPFKVLIIGGGDGWVASYLLDNFANLQGITMVDIDQTVSTLTLKHFAKYFTDSVSLTDDRVRKFYQDAAKWLRDPEHAVPESYDVVIIDCTDHTKESSKILYTQEFYSNLNKVLKPNGKIVQQMNTVHDDYGNFFDETAAVWEKAGFTNLVYWDVTIPSFGGESLFWLAEK